MNKKHSTPIQIRFNDFDLAGHIYNAVYQEYLDSAKMNYFSEVLGDLIDWKTNGLVIASIQIDYASPILLGDTISIKSRVSEMGDKSIKMTQFVMKNNETEPVATGITTLVCFNFKKRESILIPDEWRQAITNFETDL